MKNWAATLAFVAILGVLGTGCAVSPASPSATSGAQTNASLTIGSLSSGTWGSLAADPLPGTINLNPGSCGNFKWSVASLTPIIAAGTFSADCGGGLSLAGSATASLNGTSAAWGASGNVTGSMTCTFTVAGTAALESAGVRVTYNGTVCGTTITGSELLKKR